MSFPLLCEIALPKELEGRGGPSRASFGKRRVHRQALPRQRFWQRACFSTACRNAIHDLFVHIFIGNEEGFSPSQ